MEVNGTSWNPASWTKKPAKQEVIYEDQSAVQSAVGQLNRLPPIVTPTEIIKLRKSLRDVALGKAFLLQGGDCAELFAYCEQNAIEAKIKLLLQMSIVLIWGANKPVVRIARMAGQYAKPRSSPTEMLNGKQIPSFRGDILNGYDPDHRQLDPQRLVSAYHHSAATLNYIRAAIGSGIADLHSPLDWGLGHVRDESIRTRYQTIVQSITDSLNFMRTVGADSSVLESVDLFTSHEGLLLEYEQSLTRKLRHPPARAHRSSREGARRYRTSRGTSCQRAHAAIQHRPNTAPALLPKRSHQPWTQPILLSSISTQQAVCCAHQPNSSSRRFRLQCLPLNS